MNYFSLNRELIFNGLFHMVVTWHGWIYYTTVRLHDTADRIWYLGPLYSVHFSQ